ncbi:hypothetical protein H4R99_001897 [Coemansia sp. RSA 1722]|nr:hypothetical protein LPJ57_002772 [Coemansia sp. RSA 486]KAJ2236448.1 hypothetical protein IWW45_001782 [Coemansia sp. RSA 485]KAJ2604300.1 hypothetical protein H4R99_001897 [Coemansia sp. RSA 1722]KAJ2637903.1 hypothetical protein GGF40_002028 [Coemansia sp. RSA 1286]
MDDNCKNDSENLNKQSEAPNNLAAQTDQKEPVLDPDDPETQQIAASLGFSTADLRHLQQLTESSCPLATEPRGWTFDGIQTTLNTQPDSATKRFLQTLLILFTNQPAATTTKPPQD